MKKLLLLTLLASGLLASDCSYNYENMLNYKDKMLKANQLKMIKERQSNQRMFVYYTNNSVLTCGEGGEYFKIAMAFKKINDEMGLK